MNANRGILLIDDDETANFIAPVVVRNRERVPWGRGREGNESLRGDAWRRTGPIAAAAHGERHARIIAISRSRPNR